MGSGGVRGTLLIVLLLVLVILAGQWWLLGGAPVADAATLPRLVKALQGSVVVVGVIVALGLAWASRQLVRQVGNPAAQLAAAAERVAAGDLTVHVAPPRRHDEIGRLGGATRTMIAELRRLATALTTASRETAAMSAEITAGAQQIATSAGEMAHTSSDLSVQAGDMAQSIQVMADDASQLVAIAAELEAGAREGVDLNAHLRQLAQNNRARLDENGAALETLAAEAQSSAAAIEALAGASEEIRSFVTLVRMMARQSKLLALNAAMEAARAGEQGEGFAVVASEVRRLATTSSDAAERTETLVTDVLGRMEQSRASSARTSETVQGVLAATRDSYRAFGEIEDAVLQSDSWTDAIAKAATSSSALIAGMTQRLDAIARGTESFAAAMQQVAASSQEQSASTEEIASVAEQLGKSAARLAELVATFRLDGDRPRSVSAAPVSPSPRGRPAAA